MIRWLPILLLVPAAWSQLNIANPPLVCVAATVPEQVIPCPITHGWLLDIADNGGQTCKHCPVGYDLDAQFPEAPSTVKHHFFTKKWLAAEAIQAGATSFDAYQTVSNEGRCGLEGHNGFPEYESGKELAGEGAIEFGFGWFIRALAFRAPKSFGWISYMTPVYGSALHLRGGIEWYNRCH